MIGLFNKLNVQTFLPIIVIRGDFVIIIGDVHKFIGHCLIPLEPWILMIRLQSTVKQEWRHLKAVKHKKIMDGLMDKVNYKGDVQLLWKRIENIRVQRDNTKSQWLCTELPYYRLLLVETFGHSTKLTNQSIFNKGK